MKKADIYNFGMMAGHLEEIDPGKLYKFTYLSDYEGSPVSLSMPVAGMEYIFDCFPPFFEGLLPEGTQLEGLVRKSKVDKNDFMGLLLAVGGDLVGSVTVKEAK